LLEKTRVAVYGERKRRLKTVESEKLALNERIIAKHF